MLDEADRLLDMGFREQLDAIMARLPRQRRTGAGGSLELHRAEGSSHWSLRLIVSMLQKCDVDGG